jgi:2-oxoglutarate ferredoxin oxidoreductase subunit gamma
MQQEIVFSGFGGQGVMFVGQLLAYAAMDAALHVTWIPSYGPEMRGGTAHCYVVVSDQPIGSPIVRRPKIAVAFNNPSYDKYESVVAPDGLLVVNRSLVVRESARTDIDTLYVPATEIADEIGNAKITNIVLLGAMLARQSVLSIEQLKAALDGHIPAHRRSSLALNYQALERGAAFASGLPVA